MLQKPNVAQLKVRASLGAAEVLPFFHRCQSGVLLPFQHCHNTKLADHQTNKLAKTEEEEETLEAGFVSVWPRWRMRTSSNTSSALSRPLVEFVRVKVEGKVNVRDAKPDTQSVVMFANRDYSSASHLSLLSCSHWPSTCCSLFLFFSLFLSLLHNKSRGSEIETK